MAAFLAFYVFTLFTLLKHMGRDPLLCGLFAALVGYVIVMLLNVAQPILLSTYFPLCGLAFSRIRRLEKKERAVNLEQLIGRLKKRLLSMENVTHWETIPAKEASFAPFPAELDNRLPPALAEMGRV